MEKLVKLIAPVMLIMFLVTLCGCDCKDDDELRRLEKEKQNQILQQAQEPADL